MAKPYIPPPEYWELLLPVAKWIARRLKVKITITIFKHEKNHSTTEYDYRET